MSMLTVVIVGVIIVFLGLVCLIAIVSMMGMICKKLFKEETEAPKAVPSAAPVAAAAPAASPIPNREELIVAFSAAVAEELGTDVSAIRVVSLKEIK